MPDQDPCLSLQQCLKKTARWPGTWRVVPKRAICLMPRKPSQILIVQGHAWITWEAGMSAMPAAGQDVFLAAGQILDVPAGVRLVMESVDPRQPVDFDWRTMPPELSLRPAVSLRVLLHVWCRAWLLLVQASAHLLWGLVHHAGRGVRWRKASGPAL